MLTSFRNELFSTTVVQNSRRQAENIKFRKELNLTQLRGRSPQANYTDRKELNDTYFQYTPSTINNTVLQQWLKWTWPYIRKRQGFAVVKYCLNANAITDVAGMFYDVTLANNLSRDHHRNNLTASLN
jgi:hypothetical protein